MVLFTAARSAITRYQRLAFDRSIRGLMESAAHKDNAGHCEQALIDLDTARALLIRADRANNGLLKELNSRRREIAGRDARAIRDRLLTCETGAFPIGEWLNLQARTEADPDLAALKAEIETIFPARLNGYLQSELVAARSEFQKGRPSEAYAHCDRVAALAPKLPPDLHREVSKRLEQVLGPLITRHGLVLRLVGTRLISGSEADYRAEIVPLLVNALKEKGYLSAPANPTNSAGWLDAPYLLNLEIDETREGNYLSTENRLTRIEARLILYRNGREIWRTNPSTRTAVPLPHVPAYVSSRIAISTARVEEFERLLYADARGRVAEKFSFALGNMPVCAP